MNRIVLTLFCGFMSTVVLAQANPYSAQKKKYPLGDEFEKILPLKIGNWNRFAFHDFVIGRENGSVYYRQDDRQIYITFGKTYNQTDLNSVWDRIYDNATSGKENQIKQKNISSPSSKYVLMNGKSGLFYAWTRNFYYFNIKKKNKTDADEFMKLFPY